MDVIILDKNEIGMNSSLRESIMWRMVRGRETPRGDSLQKGKKNKRVYYNGSLSWEEFQDVNNDFSSMCNYIYGI